MSLSRKIGALEGKIADYNRAFDVAVRENDEEMMKTHSDLITVASSNLTKLRAEKLSNQSGWPKIRRCIIFPPLLELI